MKKWLSKIFKSNGTSAAGVGGSLGIAALIGSCGGVCTTAGFSLAAFLGSIGFGAAGVYLPYFRIPLLIVAAILGIIVIRREIKIGNPARVSLVSLVLGGGLVFGGIQAFKDSACNTCSKVDAAQLFKLFSPDSRKVLQTVYRMWPELGRSPTVPELQAAMGLSSTEKIQKAFDEVKFFEKQAGLESAFNEKGEMKWLWPLSNENHGILVQLEGKKPMFARCAVDALGISTMFGLPATVQIETAQWHKKLELQISGAQLVGGDDVSVAYGEGSGCNEIRFYSTQEEFDEYKKQSGKDLKSLSIQAALNRGIEVFGTLLQEPKEITSVSMSGQTNVVLTKNYDEAPNSGCQMACAFKGNYEQADIKEQPGVKVGDLTRCPVSGVVFRVTEESPTDVSTGTQLYFCCNGCRHRFTQEPNRFVTIGHKSVAKN